MQVAKNKVVSIDYTLTGTDGEVIDSSDGGEPLSYIHGTGSIIPGLESALDGKSVGDTLAVTVAPEDGYGEHQPELIQEVPSDQFQFDGDLEVGMQFQASTAEGVRVFTITAIEGDTVTVDGNHPLAGETLAFDVTVQGIRDATEEELEHGHVHGPEGHSH